VCLFCLNLGACPLTSVHEHHGRVVTTRSQFARFTYAQLHMGVNRERSMANVATLPYVSHPCCKGADDAWMYADEDLPFFMAQFSVACGDQCVADQGGCQRRCRFYGPL